MSNEIPIQTSSPDELSGGEAPLTQPERTGIEPGINSMSFCRGTEVQGASARTFSPNLQNGAASRPSESVSGMACDSPVAVSVRPVDRRTITGSTPGDFRQKAADAVMPANPEPREGTSQTKISGRTPAATSPTSDATSNGA